MNKQTLKGIKSSREVYNTYGKVAKVSWRSVIIFIALVTPLTNFVLFPLATKVKGEAFRITIKGD